jgi:transcriptional regulator with PAS, ATPase and Fis domain
MLTRSATANQSTEEIERVILRLYTFVKHRSTKRLKTRASDTEHHDLVFPSEYVVGETPEMIRVYEQMRRCLTGCVPVLIEGETGVGKEHLARIIHASSDRAAGPFVAVNCAAIPGELLEAELFGIGNGVATGVRGRPGKFAAAAGGTLFLDEIGEVAMRLQAKLLRALQENESQRVGSSHTTRHDARIITATNSDLRECVAAGKFRADLYYRVAAYVINVPSLRERTGDIPALVECFLKRFARESRKHIRGFTVGALNTLLRYRWEGNVRELENEMRRLVLVMPDGAAVDSTMMSEHILRETGGIADAEDAQSLNLRERTQHLERELINRALQEASGVRKHAARLLGITRNGLALKMRRLGLAE